MILLENLHHISLGSANIERTITFYRDIFDFEITTPLDTTKQYVVLRLDPLCIRFNFISNYHCTTRNPGETSFAFVLDVDDFTEAIHELEEKQIEIIKGPLSIENGESLLITDPDGHLIELFYQE